MFQGVDDDENASDPALRAISALVQDGFGVDPALFGAGGKLGAAPPPPAIDEDVLRQFLEFSPAATPSGAAARESSWPTTPVSPGPPGPLSLAGLLPWDGELSATPPPQARARTRKGRSTHEHRLEMEALRRYVAWWAGVSCARDDRSFVLRSAVFKRFSHDAAAHGIAPVQQALFGRLLRESLPHLRVKRLVENKAMVYAYMSLRLVEEPTPRPPAEVLLVAGPSTLLPARSASRTTGERKRARSRPAAASGPLALLQSVCSVGFGGTMGGAAPAAAAAAAAALSAPGVLSMPGGLVTAAGEHFPASGSFDGFMSAFGPFNGRPLASGPLLERVPASLSSNGHVRESGPSISSLPAPRLRNEPLPGPNQRNGTLNGAFNQYGPENGHVAYFLETVASERPELLELQWPSHSALAAMGATSPHHLQMLQRYQELLVRLRTALCTFNTLENADGAPESAWSRAVGLCYAAFWHGDGNREDPRLALDAASLKAVAAHDRVFFEMLARLCVGGRAIFTIPQCMQVVRALGDALAEWSILVAPLAATAPEEPLSQLASRQVALASVFVRTAHQHLRLEGLASQLGAALQRDGALASVERFWQRFRSPEARSLFAREMAWFGCGGCSSPIVQRAIDAVLCFFGKLLVAAGPSLAVVLRGVQLVLERLASGPAPIARRHVGRAWTVASQVLLRNAAVADALDAERLAQMTRVTTLVIDHVVYKLACPLAGSSNVPEAVLDIGPLSFEADANSGDSATTRARLEALLDACFTAAASSGQLPGESALPLWLPSSGGGLPLSASSALNGISASSGVVPFGAWV